MRCRPTSAAMCSTTSATTSALRSQWRRPFTRAFPKTSRAAKSTISASGPGWPKSRSGAGATTYRPSSLTAAAASALPGRKSRPAALMATGTPPFACRLGLVPTPPLAFSPSILAPASGSMPCAWPFPLFPAISPKWPTAAAIPTVNSGGVRSAYPTAWKGDSRAPPTCLTPP